MKKSLFVIGDSTSMLYGPYLKGMIGSVMNYDRFDTNGEDSDHALRQLRELMGSGRPCPDLLMVNCGLHDIKTDPSTGKRQIEIERYTGNLGEMIGLAKSSGCGMIWVRSTPVPDDRHNGISKSFIRYDRDIVRYNEAADRVMAENHIPVIDLYTFTKNLDGDIYFDHIHATERVRMLQAAFIAGFLYRMG